jgi:NADH-quinone oxidoreductase subunit N
VTAPAFNLEAIAPVGFVGIGAMLVLMLEILLTRTRRFLYRPMTSWYVSVTLAMVASFFLLVAVAVAGQAFVSGSAVAFDPQNPMVRLDRFSAFAIALIGIGALLSVWLSVHYLIELRIHYGEYYALVLLATAGMMLMVSAVDLVPIFLGLEILSIPIYVLAGFDRRKLQSNESSLKYFLIGSFASALLLYGMALLYGTTGSTDLERIRAGFDAANPLAVAGLGLVVVGFAFKVSAVPFHQWTPDVYQGAPTSVTAYMAVTVKVAAFATLLRFVAAGVTSSPERLDDVLWALAVATMIVGNVTAVVQDDVKRMLAYSSIAHAGYVLVGFVAGGAQGFAAVLFYLFAYLFMTLGAFGVMVALTARGRDWDKIDDWAGLARRRPGLAALMTLFMLSLAGIPGTVGFVAKFGVILAAVKAGHVWLAIVAVLTSVVSVYYYLRLPVWMYMREPGELAPRSHLDTSEGAVLWVCAFAVVFFGIFPNAGPDWLPLLRDLAPLSWVRDSAALLR